MKEDASVFVKIDEYKDILDIVDLIKQKVEEGKEIISEINQLRNQEDEEFEAWNQELIDIEKKIDFIDRNLFEPRV